MTKSTHGPDGEALKFEGAGFAWSRQHGPDGGTDNTGFDATTDEKVCLCCSNSDCSFGDYSFGLCSVDMELKQGSLTAIIGEVGSGKSSLLKSMLGELEKVSGECVLYGTIAYVPQQAWIMNATVKDNILFGKPFDEKLYLGYCHY